MLLDIALTSIKGFEFGELIANSRSFDGIFPVVVLVIAKFVSKTGC